MEVPAQNFQQLQQVWFPRSMHSQLPGPLFFSSCFLIGLGCLRGIFLGFAYVAIAVGLGGTGWKVLALRDVIGFFDCP
jgi:hypothetical protein